MSEILISKEVFINKYGSDYRGNPSEDNLMLSKHRAYALQDNDVININDLILQYEGGMFYEVIELKGNEYASSYWKKTGKTFTAEQLNNINEN